MRKTIEVEIRVQEGNRDLCSPECPFLVSIPWTCNGGYHGCRLFDVPLRPSWEADWKELDRSCWNRTRKCHRAEPQPKPVPKAEPPKPRRRKVRCLRPTKRMPSAEAER